jgi:hypothetical protein
LREKLEVSHLWIPAFVGMTALIASYFTLDAIIENTAPCLYDLAIISIDPKASAIVSDCRRQDAAPQRKPAS